VTTNMQAIIDQAFDAGRVAERELAKIIRTTVLLGMDLSPTSVSPDKPAGNGTRKRRTAAPKTAVVTEEPKAPVIARGVRKAAGPRTKGVKEAIMNLIASEPMTTADIITRTGFKPASVRATLMSLKDKDMAYQEDKVWNPRYTSESGNSDHAAANA
jgi:hypothetical protein